MPVSRWLVILVVVGGCGKSSRLPEKAKDAAPEALDSGSIDAVATARLPVPSGPYTGPLCDAKFAPQPDRDPSPMCFQPGGSFLMGSPEGEGDPDERPQRTVTLSPFYIDQFEVTRAQFARFLNEAPHGLACDQIGPPMCPGVSVGSVRPWSLDLYEDGERIDWRRQRHGKGAAWRFEVRFGEERLPMEDITIFAARAYCRWVGKTLPTEAEWEYAARVEPVTGHVRRYVWGDRFEPRRANCAKQVCRDRHEFAGPVDDMPEDVSATGVRGMAGNVAEWVDGCHTPTLEDCGDCVDPSTTRECRPRREPIVVDGLHVTELVDGWLIRGASYLGEDIRAARRRGGSLPSPGLRCALTSRARAD